MLWAEIPNSEQRLGRRLMNRTEHFPPAFRQSASRGYPPPICSSAKSLQAGTLRRSPYSFRSLVAFVRTSLSSDEQFPNIHRTATLVANAICGPRKECGDAKPFRRFSCHTNNSTVEARSRCPISARRKGSVRGQSAILTDQR